MRLQEDCRNATTVERMLRFAETTVHAAVCFIAPSATRKSTAQISFIIATTYAKTQADLLLQGILGACGTFFIVRVASERSRHFPPLKHRTKTKAPLMKTTSTRRKLTRCCRHHSVLCTTPRI